MGKHVTTEDFIVKAKLVHGNKYNYDKTVYRLLKNDVEIYCNNHEEYFWQNPHNHLSGNGCKKCFEENRGDKKSASSKATFIADSIKIHKDKYDYSRVYYVRCNLPVVLFCNDCQEYFAQTPSGHKSGYGCPFCAKNRISDSNKLSQEDYLTKIKSVHGDFYNYDKVNYISCTDNVLIGCKKCNNYFSIRPTKLYGGKWTSGCPTCAEYGFSTGIPAWLYVLTSKTSTKIGITNRDVEIRIKEINKNSEQPFTLNKIYYFDKGFDCRIVEQELLKILRNNYDISEEKHSGFTECFIGLNPDFVINYLKENYGI